MTITTLTAIEKLNILEGSRIITPSKDDPYYCLMVSGKTSRMLFTNLEVCADYLLVVILGVPDLNLFRKRLNWSECGLNQSEGRFDGTGLRPCDVGC